MRSPNFQSKKAEYAYEIVKHVYLLLLIAYFPVILMLTVIGELKPSAGFIDFGFGFSLLVTLIVAVPIFLVLLAAGLLARYLILRRTGARERAEQDSRLRRIKTAITAATVTVTLACLLFVPFSTVHYDDGGTVKHQALAYTVMEWDRMSLDTSTGEVTREPQKTRVYWFPNNWKSYEDMWEMKH